MKHLLLTLLALLVPTASFAQMEDSGMPSGAMGQVLLCTRNDSDAALTDANLDAGTCAVDSAGKLKTADVKFEDAVHSSGDVGSFILGVTNQSGSNLASANDGDYSPVAVNGKGSVYVQIDLSGQSAPGNALLKDEDRASANADALVGVATVRQSTLSNLTSTDGDYAALKSDDDGRVYINPFGSSPSNFFVGVSAADIVDTTSTAVVAAGGAGVRRYLTSYYCSNTSATATRLTILDGATAIWNLMLPAGQGSYGNFPTPLRGTANTAVNVQAATTAAAIRCSIAGYNSSN